MPAGLHFTDFVSLSPPPPACIACNACTSYIWGMNQITIRNIDDNLKRALRMRAAENGRSMEEEVRQILRHALSVPSPEDEERKTWDAFVAGEMEKLRQRRGG